MSYYRSEYNVYCTYIHKTLAGGDALENICVNAKGPCKLDSILVRFDQKTSGDFTVTMTRAGLTFEILKVTLDNESSVVVTDIGVWIPNAGLSNYKDTNLTINNDTTSNANIIIDYSY